MTDEHGDVRKPELTVARLRYALRALGRGSHKGMGPQSPGLSHLPLSGAVCVALGALSDLPPEVADDVRQSLDAALVALALPCRAHRLALYTLDAYGELTPLDANVAATLFPDPYEVGVGALVTVLVPSEPGWRDLDRLRGVVATHTGQIRISGAARGPARALWSFLADPAPLERPEHATSVRRLPLPLLLALALLEDPRDPARQRAAATFWDIRLTPRDVASLAPLLPEFRRAVAALFSGALDAPVLPVEDVETMLEAQLKQTNPPMMVGGGRTPFVSGAAGFRAGVVDAGQRAVEAVDALHERSALEPAARALAIRLGTPGLVDPREFGW
jgi:hypothetical protein